MNLWAVVKSTTHIYISTRSTIYGLKLRAKNLICNFNLFEVEINARYAIPPKSNQSNFNLFGVEINA